VELRAWRYNRIDHAFPAGSLLGKRVTSNYMNAECSDRARGLGGFVVGVETKVGILTSEVQTASRLATGEDPTMRFVSSEGCRRKKGQANEHAARWRKESIQILVWKD